MWILIDYLDYSHETYDEFLIGIPIITEAILMEDKCEFLLHIISGN